MTSTSSLPASIPDTQLGLSSSEIHLLRQHQAIALGASSQTSSHSHHYANSTASSRGRAYGRSSASTSRATSAASTGGGGGNGRLVLEAGSLAVLGRHFDLLMQRIQERVNYLTAQTQSSTLTQALSANATMANADAEIARFHEIFRQIDELEVEFDKVMHIRDIVKGFRGRVESLGSRIERRR
ncbi:MAG: hypothetical protein MMC33_008434 [Icmadophila ericetorum]|nr:hypothetical protein [Icmadophila ericetorum]